jgi:hypothetical protein
MPRQTSRAQILLSGCCLARSLRIEEPLSLAPSRDGNTHVYRAMDVNMAPFSDLRGRKDSMPH